MRLRAGVQFVVLFAAVLAVSFFVSHFAFGNLKTGHLQTSGGAEDRAQSLRPQIDRPLAGSGAPRKIRFAHLSMEDGLSHSDVRTIVQDHQGFMWFGTWLGGLNRYDGYAFKVYKHD